MSQGASRDEASQPVVGFAADDVYTQPPSCKQRRQELGLERRKQRAILALVPTTCAQHEENARAPRLQLGRQRREQQPCGPWRGGRMGEAEEWESQSRELRARGGKCRARFRVGRRLRPVQCTAQAGAGLTKHGQARGGAQWRGAHYHCAIHSVE